MPMPMQAKRLEELEKLYREEQVTPHLPLLWSRPAMLSRCTPNRRLVHP